MSRPEDTNWLDDAFDDSKNEQALIEAQKANNRGCLIAAIVGVVGVAAIAVSGVMMLASIF